MEIPGFYVPNSTNFADAHPPFARHPKLVRFASTVEVVRSNDGQQLVRRIGMVGNDGRTYHFLLQFGIPYFTRTDERTSQLNYVFSKLIRTDPIACRTHPDVWSSAVIPIVQCLRLTADDLSNRSLYNVYQLDRAAQDFTSEDLELFIRGKPSRRSRVSPIKMDRTRTN